MTIKQALDEASVRLSAAGLDTPSLDASLLLAETLGTNRARLVLIWDEPLSADARRRFDRLLDRRLSGEPVAYILGRREFFGLDFAVGPDVLIPRPDTETLVEAALETAREMARAAPGTPLSALDLCTGSGAVAVALKHEMPELSVYASDISPAALARARSNAARLLGENSVAFSAGDLFAFAKSGARKRFSLIVSNPPYVPAPVIPTLPPEVLREPRLALDGSEDGLDLIRRIIAESPDYLAPPGEAPYGEAPYGALLLEADPRQMEAISGILAACGYSGVKLYNDLSHRPRVIRGLFAASLTHVTWKE